LFSITIKAFLLSDSLLACGMCHHQNNGSGYVAIVRSPQIKLMPVFSIPYCSSCAANAVAKPSLPPWVMHL
jgi:hypothetical protein